MQKERKKKDLSPGCFINEEKGQETQEKNVRGNKGQAVNT